MLLLSKSNSAIDNAVYVLSLLVIAKVSELGLHHFYWFVFIYVRIFPFETVGKILPINLFRNGMCVTKSIGFGSYIRACHLFQKSRICLANDLLSCLSYCTVH